MKSNLAFSLLKTKEEIRNTRFTTDSPERILRNRRTPKLPVCLCLGNCLVDKCYCARDVVCVDRDVKGKKQTLWHNSNIRVKNMQIEKQENGTPGDFEFVREFFGLTKSLKKSLEERQGLSFITQIYLARVFEHEADMQYVLEGRRRAYFNLSIFTGYVLSMVFEIELRAQRDQRICEMCAYFNIQYVTVKYILFLF